MLTVAYGQSSSTAPQDKSVDPAVTPEASAHSIYHDCLLAAGTSTWTELGLNSDQVERVTALQTAYKAELAAAEKPAGKTKGAKKDVAVKKVEATVTPSVSADKSGMTAEEKKVDVEKETMDKTGVAQESLNGEPATKPEENVANPDMPPVAKDNTSTPLDAGDQTYAAVPTTHDVQGDQLAAILTPEQWNRWQKQCYTTAPTGMTTP